MPAKKATGTKAAAKKASSPRKKAAPKAKAPVSSSEAAIPAGPPPITPSSTPEPNRKRVLYENMVNEGADRFARQAHAAYIEATLAGKSVELVVK